MMPTPNTKFPPTQNFRIRRHETLIELSSSESSIEEELKTIVRSEETCADIDLKDGRSTGSWSSTNETTFQSGPDSNGQWYRTVNAASQSAAESNNLSFTDGHCSPPLSVKSRQNSIDDISKALEKLRRHSRRFEPRRSSTLRFSVENTLEDTPEPPIPSLRESTTHALRSFSLTNRRPRYDGSRLQRSNSSTDLSSHRDLQSGKPRRLSANGSRPMAIVVRHRVLISLTKGNPSTSTPVGIPRTEDPLKVRLDEGSTYLRFSEYIGRRMTRKFAPSTRISNVENLDDPPPYTPFRQRRHQRSSLSGQIMACPVIESLGAIVNPRATVSDSFAILDGAHQSHGNQVTWSQIVSEDEATRPANRVVGFGCSVEEIEDVDYEEVQEEDALFMRSNRRGSSYMGISVSINAPGTITPGGGNLTIATAISDPARADLEDNPSTVNWDGRSSSQRPAAEREIVRGSDEYRGAYGNDFSEEQIPLERTRSHTPPLGFELRYRRGESSG